MNGAPSVSVAMATYNGAAFLRTQLDSLAAQSVKPREVVISDDRSTDATASIVECFANTAPFPVVFMRNNERLGYKRNFMTAAQRCTSDLIAFCDQDDFWYREKIERVSHSMADPAVALCFHDYDVVDSAGHVIAPHFSQAGSLAPGSAKSSLGLTQTFRRSLLEFSDLFLQSRDENHRQEVMAHDQWIHFVARCRGVIRHLPQALLGYRQHESNVCGQVRTDVDAQRRLSRNVAILTSYAFGRSDTLCEKRAILLAHLNWQHFALAHRLQLIGYLWPRLSDPSFASQFKDEIQSHLSFVDDRLSIYNTGPVSRRLVVFIGSIASDIIAGTLRSRLKARALDLAYAVAAV